MLMKKFSIINLQILIIVITFAHSKLQKSTGMDIVNRLKFFMDSLQIGNSQFADNCRIPRPTLSQMLNGRNKKVSDEIIAKIHSAYPQLSVLWLMFGEGNMLTDANMQSSGSQTGHNIDSSSMQNVADEPFTKSMGQQSMFMGLDAENSATPRKGIENQKTVSDGVNSKGESSKNADLTDISSRLSLSLDADQIAAFNANSPKKIANIVVFYTDNSFQSFTPQE